VPFVLDGELVFVPSKIPRRGVFAHWGTGSGSAKLELVFPRNPHNLRKRLVSADLIPLGEALPALLAISPDEQAGAPVLTTRTSGAPGRSIRPTLAGCANSPPPSRRPRMPWRFPARVRSGSVPRMR
jgi:hypothetical protein